MEEKSLKSFDPWLFLSELWSPSEKPENVKFFNLSERNHNITQQIRDMDSNPSRFFLISI